MDRENSTAILIKIDENIQQTEEINYKYLYITMFLYQKLIDCSTPRQGFQIPVEFHRLLKAMPGGMPLHGEKRNVKVVIDGVGCAIEESRL